MGATWTTLYACTTTDSLTDIENVSSRGSKVVDLLKGIKLCDHMSYVRIAPVWLTMYQASQ